MIRSASRTGSLARWETEVGPLGVGQTRWRCTCTIVRARGAYPAVSRGSGVLPVGRFADPCSERAARAFRASVEPRKITMLKEQIARFLHKHEDDNRESDITDYAVPLGRGSAQP
jgi:hypothetical protein